MGSVALSSVFAEVGLHLELVHELYFPQITLLEGELVVTTQNLKLIGQLMSANLVDFKQIYDIALLTHIEVPDSKELTPQAVDGLVG